MSIQTPSFKLFDSPSALSSARWRGFDLRRRPTRYSTLRHAYKLTLHYARKRAVRLADGLKQRTESRYTALVG